MKSTSTSIVPFELIQKNVNLAIAEVIRKKKQGQRLSEHPYSAEFFAHHIGKRTPNKKDLISFCSNGTCKQMIVQINRFIESKGHVSWGICRNFKFSAFPSLAVLENCRFENSWSLHYQRDKKIETKALNEHESYVKTLLVDMLRLNRNSLPEWVSEHDTVLSEYELVDCLSAWHSKNVVGSWCFHDLYRGISSSRIALDLSWGD